MFRTVDHGIVGDALTQIPGPDIAIAVGSKQ